MTSSIAPTSEQTALYAGWFQKKQTDKVPLLEADPIVGEESQQYAENIFEFASGVVNGETVTKDQWKKIFSFPFDKGLLSLEGIGADMFRDSSDDDESDFSAKNLGSTFRQLAVNLVVTDPKRFDTGTAKFAYEAAVELLGYRNPMTNTNTVLIGQDRTNTTSASSTATATAASTTTKTTPNGAAMGLPANATAVGGT
jgi:hypothetical protein